MPSVLPCCVFRFHGGIVTKQRAAESCCLRSRAHPSSVLSRQQLRTRARHSTCSDTHCSAEESTAASRRSLLAGAFLLPLSVGAACAAEVDALPAASTDIIEGTQRWADLGFQALGVQLQQVANGDAPDDVPDLQERRRRFGVITVPGLSSFSFVHGLLVGCAVIALLSADRLGLGGSSTTTSSNHSNGVGSGSGIGLAQGSGTASGLDPEVEKALAAALADVGAFHDPQVHDAIEDVKRDISNISKYRENETVMQAFQKLLEIEGILERL